MVQKRYSSWDSEIGKQIEEGKADFEYLEKKAKEFGEPKVPSAKQVLQNTSSDFVSLKIGTRNDVFRNKKKKKTLQELAEMIFQSSM